MVYITSDLFGPIPTLDREQHSMPSFWTTAATPQQTPSLGKRKRQDLNGPIRSNPEHIGSKHHGPHSLPSSDRESTRLQSFASPAVERNHNLSYALLVSTPTKATADRRPFKQLKRLGPKAPLVKSTSHLMDVEPSLSSNFPQPDLPAEVASDLRPCHACNLAPRRKRDLVNYLDCRRCDGRTCYICARECVQGCGGLICKKCIVEVGQEGDSWCLDCYSRHINS